jgi:hypothetical protein
MSLSSAVSREKPEVMAAFFGSAEALAAMRGITSA